MCYITEGVRWNRYVLHYRRCEIKLSCVTLQKVWDKTKMCYITEGVR